MKKPHPQPAKPIDRQALADGLDMLNDDGERTSAISDGLGWEDAARVPIVFLPLFDEQEEDVGGGKEEPKFLGRDEARAWLQKAKFSSRRQEFILAVVFDELRKPGKLAERFNKTVDFVRKQLHDPAIKIYTAVLRRCLQCSLPLPPLDGNVLAQEFTPIRGFPLPISRLLAQQLLKPANLRPEEKVWARGDSRIPWSRAITELHGLEINGSSEGPLEVEIAYEVDFKIPPTTAQDVIKLIMAHPALLLHDESKTLREAFVDILEAAKYGDSARRVEGIVPEGKRNEVVSFATTVLQPLAAARPGNRLDYPIGILNLVLRFFWGRVSELQEKWEKREPAKGEEIAGITRFRELHGKEFAGITDKRLLLILTGEAKKIAATLAEEATGVAAETFLRAQRDCAKLKNKPAA